jgi:hypothetical protein
VVAPTLSGQRIGGRTTAIPRPPAIWRPTTDVLVLLFMGGPTTHGEKTVFLSHICTEMIFLPRQARDKCRESTQKQTDFSGAWGWKNAEMSRRVCIINVRTRLTSPKHYCELRNGRPNFASFLSFFRGNSGNRPSSEEGSKFASLELPHHSITQGLMRMHAVP